MGPKGRTRWKVGKAWLRLPVTPRDSYSHYFVPNTKRAASGLGMSRVPQAGTEHPRRLAPSSPVAVHRHLSPSVPITRCLARRQSHPDPSVIAMRASDLPGHVLRM